MLVIVLAMCGMAAKDFLGTFLVVAESHGRATLAGLLDSASDFVNVGVTIICAAAFINHGLTRGITVLCATAATSFVSTSTATRLSQRLLTHGKATEANNPTASPPPAADTPS